MKHLAIFSFFILTLFCNTFPDEVGGECVSSLNGVIEPLNDPDTACIKACRVIESRYHLYYCNRNQLMCICK